MIFRRQTAPKPGNFIYAVQWWRHNLHHNNMYLWSRVVLALFLTQMPSSSLLFYWSKPVLLQTNAMMPTSSQQIIMYTNRFYRCLFQSVIRSVINLPTELVWMSSVWTYVCYTTMYIVITTLPNDTTFRAGRCRLNKLKYYSHWNILCLIDNLE